MQRQRWFLDQLHRKAPVEDHELNVQEESQQALDMDLTEWSHKEQDWLYPHKQATHLYRNLSHQQPQHRQWPSHGTRLLDHQHQAREGKAHPTMQETKHSSAVSQHHKIPNATHQQIRGLSNINRSQLRVRERHLCNHWDCYGNCWSE